MSGSKSGILACIMLLLLLAVGASAVAQSKQAGATTNAKGAQAKMLQTIYFGAG